MSLPCQGRSQLSLFVKLQTSYTNRVIPRDGSLTKKTKSSAQQRRVGSIHGESVRLPWETLPLRSAASVFKAISSDLRFEQR